MNDLMGMLGGGSGQTSKEFGSSQATTTLGSVTRNGSSSAGGAAWLPWAVAGLAVLVVTLLFFRR